MANQMQAGGGRTGWALFLLAAALFLAKCWDGVLLEDPARYAAVAKSILATGDWVTMHQTPATPYFNKPPLYFWATALLFRLAGPAAWAARFWSGLAGAVAAVLLFDAARRLAGWRVGLLAGLLLALTNDFLRYGATGRLDAPLVCCMTAAAWSYARWCAGGRSRWLLGVGLACGLGVLVKGPPVLVMLPALAGAALLAGRLRRLASAPALWAGLLAGAALAAPWHLAVAEANPGFWDHYVGREMVDRIEGDWKAGKPRPHYLGVLLEHGLPWTPFWLAGAGLAVQALLRQRRDRRPDATSVHATDRKRSEAEDANGAGDAPPASPTETGPPTDPAAQVRPAQAAPEADASPPGGAAALAAIVLPWLIVAALAAFAPPRMYGRYLVLLHPPLAALGALALVRIVPDRALGHLRRRLWIYGVAAGVLLSVLPFTRHEDPGKTAVPAAAALVEARLGPDDPVPLYLVEVHAPRAVVYFYTGRESRLLDAPAEAAGAPLVLTSKAGMHYLAPFGYRPAVRSDRLWVAERVNASAAEAPLRPTAPADGAVPPAADSP
ncbi:MAG: ArnT family glycosyltransferase [Planctomycetota bacterium]